MKYLQYTEQKNDEKVPIIYRNTCVFRIVIGRKKRSMSTKVVPKECKAVLFFFKKNLVVVLNKVHFLTDQSNFLKNTNVISAPDLYNKISQSWLILSNVGLSMYF